MSKKTERVDPLGVCQHPFCRKTSKNLRGTLWENFFPEKKSHNAEKNWKGGTFGLARYCMLRGKRAKKFWFSSLGQMVQFGAIIFCRTFVELFWSVQVVLKKTLTKSHDYSQLFSKKSAH